MYGFNLGEVGLSFICIVVTTAFCAAGYMYYQYRIVEPGIRAHGPPPLEDRLYLAIPASILMPIGLFIFAWTSRPSVHWIVGLIGASIYGVGFYILLQCLLLYVPLVVSLPPKFIPFQTAY